MPAIQIYLNQELFDYVKKDKSKIIQQALKEYKEKHVAEKNCSSPIDATVSPA